jgi:hypothetical protein
MAMEAQGSAAPSPAIDGIAAAPNAGASAPAIAPNPEGWFESAASPQFALPLLTLLCLATLFVNLGGYPLYTHGETREAVTVLDMFKGHSISSFLLPMRAGIEIPSKPLLMHWLIAALSLITGSLGEWTIRLPSAILATLGVLCCYLYVRRLFSATAGLFAAVILATNFQYLQAAGGARVDMTLTFFMEIAFFEFLMIAEGLTARRMLLYLAMAAAVLAKGPVGVVLPGAVAAIFIAAQQRWSLLERIDLLKGAVVVAILAGGWYLAATLIGGRAFFDKQILAENVFTFLHHRGMDPGHGHPFYYVELTLLAGFLPWSLMMAPAAMRLANRQRLSESRLLYLVIWFAVVLIFYNFAAAKRGVYLLALYPALAALIGFYLADERIAPMASTWTRLMSVGMGIFFAIAGVSGLIAAAVIKLWPGLARLALAPSDIKAPYFVPALSAAIGTHGLLAIAIGVIAAGAGYVLIRTAPGVAKLASATAVGVACLAMVANLYVQPAIANTIGLKDFTAQAVRIMGDGKAAYVFGLNYDIAFYSGKTIPVVAITPDVWPEYLILGEDTYQVLAAREMRDYTPVLRSGPTDLDGTGEMILARRKPR